MKFIVTTTYRAKRMTIKQLLKEDFGWFVERVDEQPCRIDDNRYWLEQQDQRRKVYYLVDESESAELV